MWNNIVWNENGKLSTVTKKMRNVSTRFDEKRWKIDQCTNKLPNNQIEGFVLNWKRNRIQTNAISSYGEIKKSVSDMGIVEQLKSNLLLSIKCDEGLSFLFTFPNIASEIDYLNKRLSYFQMTSVHVRPSGPWNWFSLFSGDHLIWIHLSQKK